MKDEDFSRRLTPSWTEGVLLAVNAVADAALAVEGPGCVFEKAEIVCRAHDVRSTLFQSRGADRIATTDNRPVMVYADPERLAVLGASMIRERRPGAMFLMPFTVPHATGFDTEAVAERLRRETSHAVHCLPCRTLDGDWLDGWEAVFEVLADELDLQGSPEAGAVTLAGPLFTRNEGDDLGNVAEIRRLLGGLGLRVVSAWPDGGAVDGLRQAGRGRYVLSTPYARRVASRLALRTGATEVATGLPVGLSGTTEWLLQVARETGVPRATAEAFVLPERDRAAERLKEVVSLMTDRIRVALLVDPFLAAALVPALDEIGIRVPLAGLVSATPRLAPGTLPADVRVIVDPSGDALDAAVGEAVRDEGASLLLGGTRGQWMAHHNGIDLVELGYPSHLAHFLDDRPFLGFRGFVHLVERIVNAWSHQQAWAVLDEQRRAWQARHEARNG